MNLETIKAVRSALKNDAAGNRICTMTDLDLACDMLDELARLIEISILKTKIQELKTELATLIKKG